MPSIYSSARRRVSANFDNTSKIRAFGSVRIFGDDAKGLSFGTGREILFPNLSSEALDRDLAEHWIVPVEAMVRLDLAWFLDETQAAKPHPPKALDRCLGAQLR